MTSQKTVRFGVEREGQKKDNKEVCDMRVFDYDSWKTSELRGVVLSQLDFEEEILL